MRLLSNSLQYILSSLLGRSLLSLLQCLLSRLLQHILLSSLLHQCLAASAHPIVALSPTTIAEISPMLPTGVPTPAPTVYFGSHGWVCNYGDDYCRTSLPSIAVSSSTLTDETAALAASTATHASQPPAEYSPVSTADSMPVPSLRLSPPSLIRYSALQQSLLSPLPCLLLQSLLL